MPLVLFRQALGGGFVVAGYDLILYAYPYRVAAAAALAHGRFPFWNPDIYLGVPFFANIQSAVLYPVNWLFSWPGGPQMLTWSLIINLAIGALLFYAFARRALLLVAGPALIGALAYGFSGFVIAQSEHLNQNGALAWMPGVILAIDQAYRTRRPAWAGILGLCLAVQIFAGAPQEIYYTVILGLLWLIVLLVRDRALGIRHLGTGLFWPAAGLVVGLLVSAVQLLPTAELTRYSVRSGGLPLDEALAFSLPLRGVLGNLLADFGAPLYTEWAGYVGLIASVLAALAAFRRWRDPVVAVLGVTAVAAVLVALGRSTPLFFLAYHLVPGFSSFRVPARALMLSTFALAALAGLGASELEALLRSRRDWRWAAPLLLGPLLLVVYAAAYALQRRGVSWAPLKLFPVPVLPRQLIGWLALLAAFALMLLVARRRGVAASAMLAPLLAIELLFAAQPLNPLHALPASVYATDAALNAVLPSDASPYRSLSLARPSNASLADTAYRGYDTRRAIDQPDLAMESGRATLDGYDGGLLPLASYVRFRRLLLPAGSGNPPDFPLIALTDIRPPAPLLEALGVRDLVVSGGVSRSPESEPVLVEDGFTVLRDPAAKPRAFLVHEVQSAGSSQQAVDLVASGAVAPDRSAVVTGPACATSPASAQDQVDLLRNDPERVEVRTVNDAPGLLVVSSTDYPGWRATVDGAPVTIREVDGLLQGVCLPAGRHTVAVSYLPDGWGLALGLSILGLVLVLGLLAVQARRRSHRIRLQRLDRRR